MATGEIVGDVSAASSVVFAGAGVVVSDVGSDVVVISADEMLLEVVEVEELEREEVEGVLLELVGDSVFEVELELCLLLDAVVVACRVVTSVVVLSSVTILEDVLVSVGSAKAVTVTVMITSPSSAGALDRGRMEVVSCPGTFVCVASTVVVLCKLDVVALAEL